MDRKIEKPFMTIKEWAVKHMEYVPRSSSTHPDGTENHPTENHPTENHHVS